MTYYILLKKGKEMKDHRDGYPVTSIRIEDDQDWKYATEHPSEIVRKLLLGLEDYETQLALTEL